jgi:hypothetical protein
MSGHVTLCNYLKDDGILCGSPALRGSHRCYFHLRLPDRPTIFMANPFHLPIYTDNPVVQEAVMTILAQYRSGALPFRDAKERFKVIFYANNLLRSLSNYATRKKTKPQPASS